MSFQCPDDDFYSGFIRNQLGDNCSRLLVSKIDMTKALRLMRYSKIEGTKADRQRQFINFLGTPHAVDQ